MNKLFRTLMVLTLLTAMLGGCTPPDTAQTTTTANHTTTTAPTTATEPLTTEPETTTELATTAAVTTTKKPVTTTRKPVILTTAAPATTKPAATTRPPAGRTPHEISVSGLRSKMPGATVVRAWRIADNATGTKVEVHKLSYGKPFSTTYKHSDGKTYTHTIQSYCFVAMVSCKPTQFRNTCAELVVNKDEALVNDMAKKVGALVAINNEGYSGHWSPKYSLFLAPGPVIKEGQLVQNTNGEDYGCFGIYKNGTWVRNLTIGPDNYKSEIDNGLFFTMSKGGAAHVIWDGKRTVTFKEDLILFSGLRNRTFFAQVDANNYLLMVGEFMDRDLMVDILLAYGAQKGFRVNGGNCSYMYLKGVGNVTGSIGPSLRNLDKLNRLEQEWKGDHKYLGPNHGGPCPAKDMIYVK